jgi:hypothetical protein
MRLKRGPVRIRGAVHIHSTLSRDGTMTIAELATYFKQRGFQFLAISEHAEDMDGKKIEALVEQSAANSADEFCVIAGLEFAVTRQIHIVAVGITSLIELESPVYVAERVREHGGFSILAHPRRLAWDCPPDVLHAVDAAEVWNIGNDGKYLPSAKALPAFSRMREINPHLYAMGSHDFHRRASFYELAVELDVNAIARDPILQTLKRGDYVVRSPFFNCDSNGRVSAGGALVRHVSAPLETLRHVRAVLGRREA